MKMKIIILIVGTRPNFIKAFPVYHALKNDFKLILIHTGQHFDSTMSDIFLINWDFPFLTFIYIWNQNQEQVIMMISYMSIILNI